ncbi:MAG TPA: metalloregulator ArsR/SmtB family transcription factor [Candidatus Sulfotelmatobacter sp.]|nr:metalloregulator ArsR/SmtB family transcription factor [Candidatus Sulfotelmatobacter sp.]
MINDKIIELVARRFQVLGEPCRLRILNALQSGAMTVSQIVEHLDGNQPNISKHLQILFDAGLVGRKRSGNSIFYSIADPVVFRLCELVCRSTARQAASLQKHALANSFVTTHRRVRVATSLGAN